MYCEILAPKGKPLESECQLFLKSPWAFVKLVSGKQDERAQDQ